MIILSLAVSTPYFNFVSAQIASEIGGADNVISIQELIAWYEKQAQ